MADIIVELENGKKIEVTPKWLELIDIVEKLKFGKIEVIIINGEPDRINKGVEQRKLGLR